jgi:hypothetical protein
MTTYWAYKCKFDNSEDKCGLINKTNCLISIDEMAIPEEAWCFCWITGEPVLFVLQEVMD